jgi:hypothetical protein
MLLLRGAVEVFSSNKKRLLSAAYNVLKHFARTINPLLVDFFTPLVRAGERVTFAGLAHLTTLHSHSLIQQLKLSMKRSE